MPRRQRWTPVKGTGTRVASPVERALALRRRPAAARAAARRRRSTRPALAAGRACARSSCCASIASGTCSCRCPRWPTCGRPIPRPGSAWPSGAGARRSPGGRPWTTCSCGARRGWAGPARGRRATARSGARRARLRGDGVDLALDLQGDVRAALADGAHGGARARGLRQHGRGAAPHARGAARRDRLLGGAEPPRRRARRRDRRPWGGAPAWRCWARPTASARGPSSARRAWTDGARWSACTRAADARSSSGTSGDGARWRRGCSGSSEPPCCSRAAPPIGRWRRRSRAASAGRSATSPAGSPCSTRWP